MEEDYVFGLVNADVINYFDDDETVSNMDRETINQDFDDVDLFGEKMIGDDEDDDNCDIAFE